MSHSSLSLLILWLLPAVLCQTADPLSDLVSQALSVYTDFKSYIGDPATRSEASTTQSSRSPSTLSTSTSASRTSSASSSTRESSSTRSRLSVSASAAASSSSGPAASAAAAAANSTNVKNRTLAIALGVVLGLVAIAIILGLLLCCLRRRRRRHARHSRRSLSPDSLMSGNMEKEKLAGSHRAGHSRSFMPHRSRKPLAAGAAPIITKGHHGGKRDTDVFPGDTSPTSYRGVSHSPVRMQPTATSPLAQHPSPKYVPLSSHSRSNMAAAGLGGAALGAMAAKHHNEKTDRHDHAYSPINNDNHPAFAGKPIGDGFENDRARNSIDTNPSRHSMPEEPQRFYSRPNRHAESRSASNSPSHNSYPPAYNGNTSSSPLSSNPTFPPGENDHHDSSPQWPLMAGAADSATASNRDSSLTGRRSWDPYRPSPHNGHQQTTPRQPPSILANAFSRDRHFSGTTHPYIPPSRSVNQRTRFSDTVHVANNRKSGNGDMGESSIPESTAEYPSGTPGTDADAAYTRAQYQHQAHLHPRMSGGEEERLVSAETPVEVPSDRTATRRESPQRDIPGGWRNSGEWFAR